MIRVEIQRDKDARIYKVSCEGHAETADYGQDIVCAAVSMAVQCAYLGLEEHLHRRVEMKSASGDFQMELQDRRDDLSEAILATLVLGVKNIAIGYPKAVEVLEVGGESNVFD